MDTRVLAFTIGVTLLIALVAAMGPLLMVGRDNAAAHAMAGARVIAGRSHLQLMAIGIQAAGAVVLLVGAGLLGRTLFNESTVDPGFTADNSFQMYVTLPSSLAPTGEDRRRINGDVERILAGLPSVTGVTAMSSPPLSGRTNGQFVRPVPADPHRSGLNVGHAVVWHNYFDAMQIRLIAGRSFSSADTSGAEPVAIVSEEMARVMWTPETAVGRQFHHPNGDVTVIGVAADVRNKALAKKAEPLFYLPAAQTSSRNLSFIVSTSGTPASVMTAAQRAVWDAMPSVTLAEVTTFDALRDRALAPSRYRTLLASIFAVLAVAMTLVGVAGLAARAIASRKTELCIRMALGATTGGARMLAIRGPLLAALVGVVIGTIVAAVTSRWLAAYLYEVRPTNGFTYGATLVFVASASVLAALAATRGVGRVDLATSLKDA
jgi:putative ABC transport system permease protein